MKKNKGYRPTHVDAVKKVSNTISKNLCLCCLKIYGTQRLCCGHKTHSISTKARIPSSNCKRKDDWYKFLIKFVCVSQLSYKELVWFKKHIIRFQNNNHSNKHIIQKLDSMIKDSLKQKKLKKNKDILIDLKTKKLSEEQIVKFVMELNKLISEEKINYEDATCVILVEEPSSYNSEVLVLTMQQLNIKSIKTITKNGKTKIKLENRIEDIENFLNKFYRHKETNEYKDFKYIFFRNKLDAKKFRFKYIQLLSNILESIPQELVKVHKADINELSKKIPHKIL